MRNSALTSIHHLEHPKREELINQRLLDACVDSVAKYGLQGLQMNHIIESSGFSRRTVYKYYGNKAEIINGAFIREGTRLFEDCRQRIVECKSVEDIFVFGFMYAYERIPKHPLLKELIHHNKEMLENIDTDKPLLDLLIEQHFGEIFSRYPDFMKDIKPITEYWIHAILSFFLLPINNEKSLAEIEAYVRKRFVPGLGLDQYKLE